MTETLSEMAGKRVPINFVYPDELHSHFAAHVVAQFQQDSFILSFFEIFPPPLLAETDAEKLAVLKSINHIDAKCVARIVVTPSKMREIVDVLAENLARYQALVEDPQQEKGGE